MRQLFTILLFMMAVGVQAQQRQMSYIETTKNWYYVYDEKGQRIGGLSRSSIGEVKGWGSDFIVAKYYSFYRIYDPKGKVLKSISASEVGEVVGVAGNTFTSRRGNWIITWSKEGKRISSRSAN